MRMLTATDRALSINGLLGLLVVLTAAGTSLGDEFESFEPWADAPCTTCCRPRTLFMWSMGNGPLGGPPTYFEPLVTDRPTFTPAPVTVGRGVIQLETGYAYFYDRSGTETERTHVYPELGLRVGVLADWLELRFNWTHIEGRSRDITEVERETGGGDLLLGMKLSLTPQRGVLPEMALIPQMAVPTGHPDVGAGEVLPGVIWVYAWELSDRMSLFGATQANRRVDDDHAYTELAESFGLGYSLTPKLQTFGEWFATIPHSALDVDTEHYFNGGFLYLLTHNLQLDARAGLGLNEEASDYFFGTGVSVRF